MIHIRAVKTSLGGPKTGDQLTDFVTQLPAATNTEPSTSRSASPSPCLRRCDVSLRSLKPRLLGQQAHVQVRKKPLQLFEVAAVFARFVGKSYGRTRILRWHSQAIRRAQKIAEDIGEVFCSNRRTVQTLGVKTKQHEAQVLIHLPQSFYRVWRHHRWRCHRFQYHPFQRAPTGSRSAIA